MRDELLPLLTGEILEENRELTLADLCRVCGLNAEQVIELIDEGIIEPQGQESRRWHFAGGSVRRVRCAVTLHHDLGVNWAGAALALDLLDELRVLRARLRRLENPRTVRNPYRQSHLHWAIRLDLLGGGGQE